LILLLEKVILVGATDHYKMYGEKLNHYDVNSLYPTQMCKELPLKPLDYIANMMNHKLEDFFGFCLVKVHCPRNIKIPLLPFRNKEGMIIFPTGVWYGIYFSEELKYLTRYGYRFTLISGLPFTKSSIFNKYINHFYQIKKNALTPAIKFIAKMQLNQLYGYFGRMRDLIVTKVIDRDQIEKFISSRFIKSIIEVNNKFTILLMTANINHTLLKKVNNELDNLDLELDVQIENIFKTLRSHVAISAAITAYARMEMNEYKTLFGITIYYTDTDSIFTDKPLPAHLVGPDLGQMKDELNGKVIIRALFLGNKRYCYQYYDDNGVLITVSVFSGVKRNSLTFEQFERMSKGEILDIVQPDTFSRNFANLTLRIINRNVKIQRSYNKILVGNDYLPKHINDKQYPLKVKDSLVAQMVRRVRYLFKKYLNK
jgi:hypothetical protein